MGYYATIGTEDNYHSIFVGFPVHLNPERDDLVEGTWHFNHLGYTSVDVERPSLQLWEWTRLISFALVNEKIKKYFRIWKWVEKGNDTFTHKDSTWHVRKLLVRKGKGVSYDNYQDKINLLESKSKKENSFG